MFRRRREVWWGLAGLAAVLAIFFLFAALGWPGAADICTRENPNTCWCEDFLRAGALIKQPINTWGNLGFIAIGLAVLWQISSDRRRPPALRNPMTTASPFALGYAGVLLFLGPGSMFFHASITQWGGWIDTYSLILFGSFGLLYSLTRIFGWPVYTFLGVHAALTATLGLLSWFLVGTGTPFFSVLVVLWVATELVILWRAPGGVRRAWPWLAAALGTFAAAMVIWALSQTGRPLCDPESWFQGHAVWHLLSAVAAGFIFLYLRTERPAHA